MENVRLQTMNSSQDYRLEPDVSRPSVAIGRVAAPSFENTSRHPGRSLSKHPAAAAVVFAGYGAYCFALTRFARM
jgi:hypothetical protein